MGGEGTTSPGASLTRDISRGMVAIYKDHIGRGPTKAETKVHGDMVITVLQDSLTKAEQKLQDSGRGETVRSMRRIFQDAMRDEMVALVESETGRKVVALLSDHSPSPDYAVEVLVLDGHASQ